MENQIDLVKIKVAWQVEPKILPANSLVFTNKYIDSNKPVLQLRTGDNFLYQGAWYIVESVELI